MEEVTEQLLAALRFVSERGLGGDATIGKGGFTLEVSREPLLPQPSQATHLMTLSLFHPSTRDVAFLAQAQGQLGYELVKRRGRIENLYLPVPNVWKQILVCFAEGSVFPKDGERHIYGSAPVVKEPPEVPFPVRQYGYAYPVEVNI